MAMVTGTPQEMTIGTISFEPSRLPAAVDLAVVRAAPGQRYAPPPAGTVWGRIAYLTAVADTEDEARKAIAAGEAALVVTEAAAAPVETLRGPISQPTWARRSRPAPYRPVKRPHCPHRLSRLG